VPYTKGGTFYDRAVLGAFADGFVGKPKMIALGKILLLFVGVGK